MLEYWIFFQYFIAPERQACRSKTKDSINQFKMGLRY
jgi:hypothetical protein